MSAVIELLYNDNKYMLVIYTFNSNEYLSFSA